MPLARSGQQDTADIPAGGRAPGSTQARAGLVVAQPDFFRFRKILVKNGTPTTWPPAWPGW